MEKKRTKKALIALMCACLLVAGSVSATMAWLTDNDVDNKATNTFTIGKVEISLDEAKVDEYGDPISGAARVATNEYKLIPGHTYVKDPTVTVKSPSENSYVRILVSVKNIDKLTALLPDSGATASYWANDGLGGRIFLLQNLCIDSFDNPTWDSTDWPCVGYKETIDAGVTTGTYEFRYNGVVNALAANNVLDPLFTHFTLPGTFTNTDVDSLEGLQIDVVAHAIQADGMTDAADAWSKF